MMTGRPCRKESGSDFHVATVREPILRGGRRGSSFDKLRATSLSSGRSPIRRNSSLFPVAILAKNDCDGFVKAVRKIQVGNIKLGGHAFGGLGAAGGGGT